MKSDSLRVLVPALSFAVLLAAVFWLQPRAMSYLGLNLLFNLAVPIALATIAQMLVIAINDLDLAIGTFVSFVACVAATFLHDTPVLGLLILARLAAPARRPGLILGAIAALVLLGFAAAVLGWRREPEAAFYLLPTRAWQLGVGALLAAWLYARAPRLPGWARERRTTSAP